MLQAADIVRVVGVGRNEYIATLNACKVGGLLHAVQQHMQQQRFQPRTGLSHTYSC